MHNLWLDFLIILCIILINSFFVLAEIAIITSGRPRLSIIAQSGNRGAQAALSLMQKPENFLSAVQIGITSMSILIGLYGGESMVTEHVESLIKDLPIIGLYSWSLSYAIVVIVITYLAVVAEIIPKRIAMIYPERIASIVSRVMLLITALAHPFVYVLSISVKGFLWIFNIKSIDTSTSMEEVKFVLQQAESSGTLQNIEKDILRRAIYIGDVEVCAIMTPRKQMICINIKDKEAVNIHKL